MHTRRASCPPSGADTRRTDDSDFHSKDVTLPHLPVEKAGGDGPPALVVGPPPLSGHTATAQLPWPFEPVGSTVIWSFSRS
jgi:hypothetical protein